MKQSEKNFERQKKRGMRWFVFLRFFLTKWIGKHYNIATPQKYLPEGGNLILSNHVTRGDQFIVAWHCKDAFIHYVAGENVFKNKLFRWFAEYCIGVIIHLRGVSQINTIKEMTKCLKRGENVMIFPSGTMTFDGVSQPVDASIAKVAQRSGANLVILKIEGGYFMQPRWGTSIRKGPVKVSDYIITKEELAQMKTEEVARLINENIYTDAYADQTENPTKYLGDDLAMGLEACIYECPGCGKISGLKTKGSELYCGCGFKAAYDNYGFLTDTAGNKYTITECCNRQKKHLDEKIEKSVGFKAGINEDAGDGVNESGNECRNAVPLFSDEFKINRLLHNGRRQDVGEIKVYAYPNEIRYEIKNAKGKPEGGEMSGIAGEMKRLSYDDIESIFIYMRNTLNVNLKNCDWGYELQGDFSSNALKYRDLYYIIKNKK